MARHDPASSASAAAVAGPGQAHREIVAVVITAEESLDAENRAGLDVMLAPLPAPAKRLESGRMDLVSEYAELGRAADADAMRTQLATPTTPSH